MFDDCAGLSVTDNLRFLDPESSGWSWSCSNGGNDGGEEGREEGREDGRGEDDMVNG